MSMWSRRQPIHRFKWMLKIYQRSVLASWLQDEVFEFLEYRGLIDFHPFSHSSATEAAANGADKPSSLLDQLYQFDNPESLPCQDPKKRAASPPSITCFQSPLSLTTQCSMWIHRLSTIAIHVQLIAPVNAIIAKSRVPVVLHQRKKIDNKQVMLTVCLGISLKYSGLFPRTTSILLSFQFIERNWCEWWQLDRSGNFASSGSPGTFR
ncbi:hypothetical protein HPP92_021265 [Vanilla planifolia]|uniref:Uncharacterized protein n=1 Tax=Vanilla planifolia TaxID=51239 RepID=A0A835Q1M5_VANPL|nr:hypothetical protein HPP92_021265 [Vanilla planifolia]